MHILSEWHKEEDAVLIYICTCICTSHSVMSDTLHPMDCSLQTPLFMEFSRQEYLSELPFCSPGKLPDPGIQPRSPALQTDSLPSEPPGKSLIYIYCIVKGTVK